MSNIKVINDHNFESEQQKNALQLKLFEALDGDKYELQYDHKYSNSIPSIDLMPRFYRGQGARKKANDPTRLHTFTNPFRYGGENCLCTVTPAVISSKKEGEDTIYAFPGDAEELIEKVIFLIAAEQGLFKTNIGGTTRYCVSFSLYQIHKYLELMNKQKSYSQIRTSLIIIRDSKTRVTRFNPNDGKHSVEVTKDVWSDAAIEVTGTGRGKDKCYIAFSDYVVDEIKKLNYRQVLFSRFTVYKSAFSRYLDLYLSSIWTNASYGVKEPISLLEIMESFGKSEKSIVTKRRDMLAALDDLADKGVIKHRTNGIKKKLDLDDQKRHGEEFDYIYNVEPTDIFVDEMIKSNAKKKGLSTIHESIEAGNIKNKSQLPKGLIK